jgi:hypothetical protein
MSEQCGDLFYDQSAIFLVRMEWIGIAEVPIHEAVFEDVLKRIIEKNYPRFKLRGNVAQSEKLRDKKVKPGARRVLTVPPIDEPIGVRLGRHY